MSNIDKHVLHTQQLKSFITGFLSDPAHDNQSSRSMTAEVFRIALASLEAEPVGYFGRFDADDEDLIDQCSPNIIGAFPLYAAPPAPANAEPVAWLWSNRKHPSEVTLVRPEDDEKAEAAQWSGWTYKALYAEPSAPVVDADDNFYSWFGREWHEHYQQNQYTTASKQMLGVMAESAWKAGRRAAMLQVADGNSPDGWVACSERMPDGMQTVITSNGFDIGQGWWDGEGWNSFDSHDVVPGEVTHWMPLPAAPQQEME